MTNKQKITRGTKNTDAVFCSYIIEKLDYKNNFHNTIYINNRKITSFSKGNSRHQCCKS